MTIKNLGKKLITNMIIILFIVLTLFPFFWTLSTSFKNNMVLATG